ncbi:MAG: cytochrome c3 family protein [Nitrospiraceae bacterium]|nr:cytochrome c3 family protein [Nitrospiraceae bacterium]
MNKEKFALAMIVFTMALVFPVSVFAAGAAPGSVSCYNCHKTLGGGLAKPALNWAHSIHQQNGVTCDQCHGGNPRATTMEGAMSKAHGFIGKPAGVAIAGVCNRCHPDMVLEYEKSIMGKAWLGGSGGPSCTKCHGAHNNTIPVLPPAKHNICLQCHKDITWFDQIDPMNVTQNTVEMLSKMQIKKGEQVILGKRPPVIPSIRQDLDPYKIGLIAFGGAGFVFVMGFIIYLLLEKRD